MDNQFNTLINKIDPNKYYQIDDYNGSTEFTIAMMYAITGKYVLLENHFNTLKLIKETRLIKHVVNQQNAQGWTPLMLACRYGQTNSNIKTIQLLLNNGANVNTQNNQGHTALRIATVYSNTDSSTEVVKMLLEHGADPNLCDNINKYSPLILSCMYLNTTSNFETIKLLLEYGADVNHMTKYKNTALTYSCVYSRNDNYIKVVELLLKYNADVNSKNCGNHVAFTCAFYVHETKQSNIEILRLLLKHKTDVQLIVDKGITVEKIIQVLL